MRRTTRPHAVRRTAAATAALLALGGLSACGDDKPEKADDSSAAASASTGESVDPETFVNDVLSSLEDASTAHMSMKLDGGPAAISMEGDVDYSDTPPEMAMTMTNTKMGGGEIKMVLVDSVLYVQMPNVGRGKWVKLDLDAEGSPLDGKLMEHLNPQEQLKSLEDSITKVEKVGSETVDGESLDHYTMTVRTDAFEELQDELGAKGDADLPSAVTYDLWLDDSGLLRQTEIALGDAGSVTMKLSDWGQPVTIEAPPSSDVVELPAGLASEMAS